VLQKMKANGYDAVSIYFDWGYHSPAPGVYDFTGVRDIDQLLDIAAEAGIYVIARPGPYINAETTGGRFPGWLTTQAGRARSDAPDYLAAADDWPHHVDAIIKRHQLTDWYRHSHPVPDRERAGLHRDVPAQLHAEPVRHRALGRHHRPDLPQ
jgi:beta-galactosidase GanA